MGNSNSAAPKRGKRVNQQKIGNARATGVLSLRESKLSAVPGEVWGLGSLKTLDLSFNALRELDDRVGGFPKLKTLHLSSNRLAALPAALGSLGALQTLSADGNRLAAPPAALPASLRSLTLANNPLGGALGDALWGLAALESLDVSGTGLAALDEAGVGALARLSELTLDDNALQLLPAALAALPRLVRVSARNNQLGAAPQSVAAELLADGAVNQLRLDGNPLTKEQFMQFDGVQGFLDRHTRLKNKELQGGVESDLSVAGLD